MIPIGFVGITYFKEHCDCCCLTVEPRITGEDRKEWGRTHGGTSVTEDLCWFKKKKKRQHDCFQIEIDDNRSREGWRAERVGGVERKDKRWERQKRRVKERGQSEESRREMR